MPFQILSLSGGGYFGLYTATILSEIEKLEGKRIADYFDLIAGTSVGGILAIAAANRVPMSDVVDAMTNQGERIFSSRSVPQTSAGKLLDLGRNIFGAKYRSETLKKVVTGLVGTDRRIKDLKQRLIVPAVNLTKGGPQVFKTPHHLSYVRDHRLPLVDVALATSAAPTFFPLHTIGGQLFTDGGLFANSPDQLALHEAEHFLGQDITTIRMISVGTTTSRFSFSNAVGKNMGWLSWLSDQRLPKVMISAQQILTGEMMRHRLGDHYLRIDEEQSPQQERYLALDVATTSAVSDLQGLAETSFRKFANHPLLKLCLGHDAPQQDFSSAGGSADG